MIDIPDDQDYEYQQERMERSAEEARERALAKHYSERTMAEERLIEDGECEE